LGIPQILRDIHTHARHSPHEETITIEEKKEKGAWGEKKCLKEDCKTDSANSKLFKVKDNWYCEEHLPERAVQMVYHRPTRSGEYAIVSVFQPWRIGLNNVTMTYVVSNTGREKRYKLVLRAYQAMFTRTEGAMTSTRLPHTTNFSGIIVAAKTNISVPLISPLKKDYVDEIKKIATNMTNTQDNNLEILEFKSVAEFVERINVLLKKSPFSYPFKSKLRRPLKTKRR